VGCNSHCENVKYDQGTSRPVVLLDIFLMESHRFEHRGAMKDNVALAVRQHKM
jgi:hypothetical protein